jgi:maltooligosyltrehalose trehalohydrolase
MNFTRRLPIGAEPSPEGTHFRVWAPAARSVSVVLADDREASSNPAQLSAAAGGYFEGLIAGVSAGARYWFQVDDQGRLPDPASRFQPEGPHGPSEIVDPGQFTWGHLDWPGITSRAPIVYEMHVGTFTREGTFPAALEQLPALASLGISIIEILPIAEFPGRFGWGYDGVQTFAPTRLYGRPDDVRRFVDHAHALGLGVILDVVYNHFGPDGCHLERFSPRYFREKATDWGPAINFDGPDSRAVREFVITNARYWIEEFHLDGLRLDATQSIEDESRPHIIGEIAAMVRHAAGGRRTWIVGENEPQHATLLHPVERGGCGIDALWNDDFHHAAMVALTGRREAYYTDYLGSPQEFIAAAKYGFLYQGQWYRWQHQPRGTQTRDLPASCFVAFLQNHDQVANSQAGLRIHELSTAAKCRAMTALLLLGPWVPMLFQGQEFQASAPFVFFADHQEALGKAVREGRRQFLSQFPSLAVPAVADTVPDPGDLDSFERCRLDHSERERHEAVWRLHQQLIALRRSDPAFFDRDRFDVDGTVLTPHAFALRFSGIGRGSADELLADRLIVVNLGIDTVLDVLPDPLLSPYPGRTWRTIWSSEDPAYGGAGTPELVQADGWRLPSECALVLAPEWA